jgi:hypothetical protein
MSGPLAKAQEASFAGIMKIEDQLATSFTLLYEMEDGRQRDSLNQSILSLFEQSLLSWDGFYYNWNKLSRIGKVRMDDGGLNVYTWHIPVGGGEFQYFGFIQYMTGARKEKEIRVVRLYDTSKAIKHPEIHPMTADNWFGSVYYGGKVFTYRGSPYYILFGYDMNDGYSTKKIIEQIRIEKDGDIVFGGDFRLDLQMVNRVILEYSSQVVASLKYDPRLELIVFDHLSPMESFLTGNYRFYSPDGSFDGLGFEKGAFILRKDVDARNF